MNLDMTVSSSRYLRFVVNVEDNNGSKEAGEDEAVSCWCCTVTLKVKLKSRYVMSDDDDDDDDVDDDNGIVVVVVVVDDYDHCDDNDRGSNNDDDNIDDDYNDDSDDYEKGHRNGRTIDENDNNDFINTTTTTTTKNVLTMSLTVAMNDDRRSVWAAHLDFIEQHNQEAARGLHTFTVGVNHFADMVSGLLRGREGGGGGREGGLGRETDTQTYRQRDRDSTTRRRPECFIPSLWASTTLLTWSVGC